MKRAPLYSSSSRSRATSRPGHPARRPAAPGDRESGEPGSPSGETPGAVAFFRTRYARHRRTVLLSAAGALAALFAVFLYVALTDPPGAITQHEIDAAVIHTLENLPAQPSVESRAFEAVRASVVQVRRPGPAEGTEEEETRQGGGTGVVIIDDGTILTNLHVVAGADRVAVMFADGSESPAEVLSVRPDQDLAVIRATVLPDDLAPATLTSTRDLRAGDRVIAVGFPFGLGPSVSSGIVSGLGREYRNPEGERLLTNLIQFDAAANPGNSGGPLVTEEGHVVGIVTAILNPSQQRVFIGIGFAVPIESALESAGSSPF